MSVKSHDIRSKALRMLALREHSRLELRRKLLANAKQADETDVDALLDDLEQRGWLSDERYIEQQLRYRINKGQGPLRIKQALANDLSSDSNLDAALAALDIDWHEQACRVRQKRFGSELPTEQKEKAKQWRFLSYRGFPSSLLTAVFTRD